MNTNQDAKEEQLGELQDLLTEAYGLLGEGIKENQWLRDLLARCNAFNALDCIEAKQADKDVRAALEGKEASDGRDVG